jgi:hypothetical protein
VSEKIDLYIVKSWLEETPEHPSISLPHPEDEAKEMEQSAAASSPKRKAVIEPYTGQIAGQH